MKNRLLQYFLLGALSIVSPYVFTMLFIIVSGDRYEGMTSTVIPAIISVHIIFGLNFIKKKLLQKTLLSILISGIAFGLVWLSFNFELIKTGMDMYNFWDLALTNFLAGLIVWETFFQIEKKVTKMKNLK